MNSLRNLRDYNKIYNILVTGVLAGEEKESTTESTQRNNDWKFPNFTTDINLQAQEANFVKDKPKEIHAYTH